MTGLAAGSCTVTATKASDVNYHPSSESVNVTVTVVQDGMFMDRFEGL